MFLMLFIFVVPIFIFGVLDLIPVIKSGGIKLIIVYLAISTCALVLLTLQARNIHLKSPNEYIRIIVESIVIPMD